jgi:hypothetical protein
MMADSKQEQDVYSSLPEQCRSAMALPILHSGRIAGCLLAVSTQAGYFAIPVHAAWLQHSTALLKMAFSPEHFYLPKQIALLRMPALQVQRPYLAGCQRRVLAILKTAFLGNHPLSYREAQHYVWEQIAEELLQLQSPPI